jgi:hypothetical protein
MAQNKKPFTEKGLERLRLENPLTHSVLGAKSIRNRLRKTKELLPQHAEWIDILIKKFTKTQSA